jgi:hypothetical protein
MYLKMMWNHTTVDINIDAPTYNLDKLANGFEVSKNQHVRDVLKCSMTCNATGKLGYTIPAQGQNKEKKVHESGSKTELALMKFWEKTDTLQNKDFRFLYEEARKAY